MRSKSPPKVGANDLLVCSLHKVTHQSGASSPLWSQQRLLSSGALLHIDVCFWNESVIVVDLLVGIRCINNLSVEKCFFLAKRIPKIIVLSWTTVLKNVQKYSWHLFFFFRQRLELPVIKVVEKRTQLVHKKHLKKTSMIFEISNDV